VGGRSPLLRTPLPRSDTTSRISFAGHGPFDASPAHPVPTRSATDISPCNTAKITRSRSSTGTVRPGFCDLLMTAISPAPNLGT